MILAVLRFQSRIRKDLGFLDRASWIRIRNIFVRIRLRILPSASKEMKKTLYLYSVL
jgi:hypothetical protein